MPSSALLCCLVLLAGVKASQGTNTQSEDSCAHFPAGLPHMLRELRAAFGRVKTFFVSIAPSCPLFHPGTTCTGHPFEAIKIFLSFLLFPLNSYTHLPQI